MRDRARGGGGRERGNGSAVSETTPSRNLDEETFECTPEGGGDHAVRDTMRSIGRLPASYFSLQFFPLFFHVISTSFVGKREETARKGVMCSSRSGGNFRHS